MVAFQPPTTHFTIGEPSNSFPSSQARLQVVLYGTPLVFVQIGSLHVAVSCSVGAGHLTSEKREVNSLLTLTDGHIAMFI